MANNRAAIRAAVRTFLSGQTDAGTNVVSNRDRLWDSELPAIRIYTGPEQAIPESQRNVRSIRTLELQIEVKVKGGDSVDDELDELIAEVEVLMTANHNLTDTILGSSLSNTETSVNIDGDENIGVGVLTYECKYIA